MNPADGGGSWPTEPNLPGPPTPSDLPLDALPPSLHDHVLSVAAATQTPTDMGAMLALASVSAALRGAAEVAVDGRGWREPTNLYTAIIMDSGARKSPVYARTTEPILEWEAAERERIGPDWRRARDHADVAKAKLAHVSGAAARGKATRTEVEDARAELEAAEAAVPILPRLVASDATPEQLVRLMAEQGGAMALLGPEADVLGIADGRYSDAARFDELLRAWGGESLTVDRVSRDAVHVERPALTLGICLQPGVLEDLRHARAFRGRGLMARVLWVAPPSTVGYRLTGRDVPALDTAAADRYDRTLRSLLDACRPGELHTLRIAPAALDVLYGLEADLEVEMRDGGRLAGIPDAAAKMHGQAVRLAALLEMAARAEDGRPLWTEPVGRWAMDGAGRLVKALTTHALHVLGSAGMDAHTADLVYLLRRIRELPLGSTVRDLHVAVQGRSSIATADSPGEYLADLLDGLVERGCIRLAPVQRDGPGRPPSPVIELHPTLISETVESAVPVAAEVVL